jgi:DNA invertase Pin-like site-specific DNA recombinase
MKTSYSPDNFNPSALRFVAYPNFAPATIYRISSSFAELERDLARERTMAGLSAARARGRLGGRPRKLKGKQAELAAAMLKDPNHSIDDVCEAFPHVSRRTLYRVAQASRSSATPQEHAHAH